MHFNAVSQRSSNVRMQLRPLALEGVVHVQRGLIADSRGHFSRVFCADELLAAGWTWPVQQMNHAHTKGRGSVRGLHYQSQPAAEAKLVSCIRGAMWDIAVDIRRGSPTFLKWTAAELHSDRGDALLIPPGFAHGFQALTDEVEIIYCHSAPYTPRLERGMNPLDPALEICWPLKVCNLSQRDQTQPFVTHASFEGVELN